MSVLQDVREFIITNFYISHPELVDDGASLLELGIIDSTGVLEIVDYVEREHGIVVGDADIVPENFGSIVAIAAYVERKRGSVPRIAVG